MDFSPQSIMDLIVALALDAFGIICFVLTLTIIFAPIGEALSFIPDILGGIYFGLGAKKSDRKKFFLSLVFELIPFLGTFFWWTIYVLTKKPQS